MRRAVARRHRHRRPASIVHARSVGRLFRPDDPLPRNYRHVPLAYHGRSSSLVVGGTPVTRPCGQRVPEGGERPSYEPSRRLDYELELGVYVGAGSPPGRPIRIDEDEGHLAGLSLVNDWSARDIQAWEAQPLGPFLSKSFATSVSPWVVTLDALTPYRCGSLPARLYTRALPLFPSKRDPRGSRRELDAEAAPASIIQRSP